MSEDAQHEAADSIWSFPFVMLLIAAFFQAMAAMMAGTTIPLYAEDVGAGAGLIGVIVGAFAFTALLVRPFAGPAFDAYSRKRLLIASQALIALCFALYALVSTPLTMLAVRLLHGVGIGCAGPLAMSLVSEYLPPMKFASGIAVYSLAQSLAQVIGPASGLWLIDAIGFRFTYLLSALFLSLSILGIALVAERPRERPPYRFALSRMFAREVVDKAVVLALFYTAFGAANSYLVLYCTQLGIGNIGVYFTVSALVLLVTRPLYGRLGDHIGAELALIPGVIFFAASYILLANIHSFLGLVVVAVLSAAGLGACVPLVQALAMASVSVERRGAASNTTYTGYDVGALLGPVIAGGIIEVLEPATGSLLSAYSLMWYMMLIPPAISLVFIIHWIRQR